MRPSHVRLKILEEHQRLRQQLLGLEVALDRSRSDPAGLDRLVEEGTALMADLVAHTELEDALLAPALADIDAWGPLRARALLDHHAEQRAQLQEILQAFATRDDPGRILRATEELIRDLRADMRHEERDMLRAGLLRDDPIAIDMESG